jgi:Xaa-Pro dipeptidase
VILYHSTAFGTAEQTDATGGAGPALRGRSAARAAAARQRITAWLAERDAPALVLTGPAAVAWATGGVAAPVDRTAGVDLTWAVCTREGASLITTEVEADRVREEYGPGRHGFGCLAAVPWWQPEAFVAAAQELAGAPAAALAADGHPAFGTDASADLTALRLALSAAEQADLRELGADTAAALESALAAWRPGERDTDIQARCAAYLEARGADAPVLIVGGDERAERYRHPMAAGLPVRRLAMAVAVARRGGLHAAATRFASAGPLDGAAAALRDRVLGIERRVLTACWAGPGDGADSGADGAGGAGAGGAGAGGPTYGSVLAELDRAYADAGAPGGWAGHYQGGPVGFAQREFEIAPGQASRWQDEPVRPGHAVAWNPSLQGGAKAEDTYLITAAGLERVTSTPGWPVLAGAGAVPPRPAVLEVAGG